MGDNNSNPYELRASLLNLATQVLTDNARMTYDALKARAQDIVWTPVTTEQIIAEAEKLNAFVSRK